MHPVTCQCGAPCRQRRREAEEVLTQLEKDTIMREAQFLSPYWKGVELKRARRVKAFRY